MAIKKLVKLSHPDPKVNQLQRNIEDVFTSVNQSLQTGSILASITASLDSRYPSQTINSGAFVLLSASQQTISGNLNIGESDSLTKINGGLLVSGLSAGEYRSVRIESNAYRQLEVAGINGAQTCMQLDDQTGNGAFLDCCVNGYEMYSIGKPYDQSFVLGDNSAGYDIWRYTNLGSSGTFQFALPVPVTASGFACQNLFQSYGNSTFYGPTAVASSLSVSSNLSVGQDVSAAGGFKMCLGPVVYSDLSYTAPNAVTGYIPMPMKNGSSSFASFNMKLPWQGSLMGLSLNNVYQTCTATVKINGSTVATITGSSQSVTTYSKDAVSFWPGSTMNVSFSVNTGSSINSALYLFVEM